MPLIAPRKCDVCVVKTSSWVEAIVLDADFTSWVGLGTNVIPRTASYAPTKPEKQGENLAKLLWRAQNRS